MESPSSQIIHIIIGMNRGRVTKKDYQKILRDMPNDKIHTSYSKNLNEILDERTGNSYTMAFFNDRTLSPKISKMDYKHPDGHSKEKMFRDYERKMNGKELEISKRIKTMQRSIDLYDKKRDNSYEKFLKREFRPLKEVRKESKSPYAKKLIRQSLNIVPSKERNNTSLYNSNKALKEGTMQAVFSHRGKISSKRSLKGAESTKIKKYNEDELLSKGRLAHQEGKLALSIQYFNEMLAINPNHLEGNYLLAVAYMNRNQFVKALKHFDLIAQLKPDYSKNVYVLAAISCKKMLLYEQSQKRLTKCIELFPDNADAYLYRAKLRLKEGSVDEAMLDFELARAIEPNRSHSYIGKGDCLVHMKEPEKALQCYEISLKMNPPLAVYLKIAECQYSLRRYDEAYVNVCKILTSQPRNQQALFMKGQCLVKLQKTSDANMIFQLILRSNDSKFASKTIEEMAKMKVAERDFYAAQHILERQSYLDVDTKYLERIRGFTEGVIYMMKRKFQDGVETIEALAKKNKYFEIGSVGDTTDDFLKPLVSLYIAYGYFCLGQFKSSIKHYELYMTIMESNKKKEKIALSAKYNLELCQAMISLEKRRYSAACQRFETASKIFPQKVEPFFFKALTLLQIYYEKEEEQEQKFREMIDQLSQGIALIKDNSDNASPHLYYFRSALYGSLSKWNECLGDIDFAIERSEDNIPKFFYVRGSAFSCCQSYKQAIHDLSICLSINSNYAEAFLLRSKCLQLQGETNEAFVDLQRYITLKPEDPLIHKYAGHLLFENGAFEDSILAYAHGEISIPRDLDIFSTRAKAYLLLGQFEEAAADLRTLCTNSDDAQSQIDLDVIEILLTLQKNSSQSDPQLLTETLARINTLMSQPVDGKIFKTKQFWMINGAIHTFLQNYHQGIQSFQKCIKLRESNLKESTIENQVPDVQQLQEYYIYCNHMKYNISLCHLANRNLKSAYEVAQEISVDKNKPQNIQIWNNIIRHEICGEIDSETQIILDKTENLEVFSLKNKLSKHLQPIPLDLRIKSLNSIKLCLSFPKVQPPEINPTFDQNILQGIDYNDIQSKPQAPWIRKENNYVMFTSTIQIFDNLDLLTESKTKRNEQEDIERDNSMIFQNEFYNDSLAAEKMNIEELKEKLKLGDKVQNKLKKMLDQ